MDRRKSRSVVGGCRCSNCREHSTSAAVKRRSISHSLKHLPVLVFNASKDFEEEKSDSPGDEMLCRLPPFSALTRVGI
jgi:hypothetical protein